MSLAANELQKAIYTRLAAQITTVDIYDYVPPSESYPYIRIGSLTAITNDTKSYDAQEFTIQIHAYDVAAGKKSVNTIMQNIHTALHLYNTSLTMTGFQCVFIRCEFMQSDVEPQDAAENDHYQHGVLRFRALITTN